MAVDLDGDDFDEDEERPDKSFSDEQLWQEVDSFIQRFEEAWQIGGRPNINAFLPSDSQPALYRAVLIELVEVDFERRLKLGEPARWEDYLDRYPQLAANPTVAFELPQPESLTDPTAIPEQIGQPELRRDIEALRDAIAGYHL